MGFLKHEGVKRRSGRYPWGSGKNPYQHEAFLSSIAKLRAQGLNQTEIATALGIKTTELVNRRTVALAEVRAANRATALKLIEKGMSPTAIGQQMGVNESTVRSWLDPALHAKSQAVFATADFLANAVENHKYIDVGAGTELSLGITRTKLNAAVALLQEYGYELHYIREPQIGTGELTSLRVLVPPGTEWKETAANRASIRAPMDGYSEDGGLTYRPMEPFNHISSDRVYIRYREDGGADRDGVIELRRGVPDIDLGDTRYAQVRIGVDKNNYMKGMAIHTNDIPDGYDIVYNTNKTRSDAPNKTDVFKKADFEKDPEAPYDGTTVRQKHYLDADGNERLSALNIVGLKPGANVEGSWDKWSKTLSSQFLSKQTPKLAQEQLAKTQKDFMDEFDDIMSITNPTIREKLLLDYADRVDAASVHLKAAALPRQVNRVLLPVPSLKDNEVYAPSFNDGDVVVLIRHPHGGRFELPQLVVNNQNKQGVDLLGNARDAVGINPNVAQKLSGADFDGDTVLVVPNESRKVKVAPTLKGLQDFDPKIAYPKYDGMKIMTDDLKQIKMGDVSNLITDMTIMGASNDEIARAVRHSMVVIDAVKHKLNYKLSYKENGIAQLKEKYQGGATAGAATVISKASSPDVVPHRTKGVYVTDPVTGKTKKLYIDPETGKKLYTPTGETFIKTVSKTSKRTGETTTKEVVVERTSKSKKMYEVDDAHKLSSGTTMESIYADYANNLKSMANNARKTAVAQVPIPKSRSARKAYDAEYESLRTKLRDALANAPRERKAQLAANAIVRAKKEANPQLDKDGLKSLKYRELERARLKFKARKPHITITDREWDAIQAGAISPSMLKSILANTKTKDIKARALPRPKLLMSGDKVLRARTMKNKGLTDAEIASALGVSVSTLNRSLDG